jgi:Xaa-Pro aminopeptidase
VRKIGANPFIFTQSSWASTETSLALEKIEFARIENDLVDEIWIDQPSGNLDPIEIHELEYSGKSVSEKLKMVTDRMDASKSDNLLITRLDSIAWLMNLRGNDVPRSPVIFSYVLIAKKNAAWSYTIFPRDYVKVLNFNNVKLIRRNCRVATCK